MQQQWDAITRVLHWVITLTVTFQLFSSIYMSNTATQYLFPIHEYVGLVSAAAILLFWMYSFAVQDWSILFPWNSEGLATVREELIGILRFKLPEAGRRVGLSSFVHGLGLLALTGSAVTGIFIYLIVPGGQHASPSDALLFTHLSTLHAFFGDLIWTYWIGHAAFAVLHQLAGTSVIRNMFGFSGSS